MVQLCPVCHIPLPVSHAPPAPHCIASLFEKYCIVWPKLFGIFPRWNIWLLTLIRELQNGTHTLENIFNMFRNGCVHSSKIDHVKSWICFTKDSCRADATTRVNWQQSCVWFSSPWFGLTGHTKSSAGTAAGSGGWRFSSCIHLKRDTGVNFKAVTQSFATRLCRKVKWLNSSITVNLEIDLWSSISLLNFSVHVFVS